MTWKDLKPYFDITLQLMSDYNVPIRDTWSNNDDDHLDDYWINNEKFHGQRQIRLEYVSTGFTRLGGHGVYSLDERKHIAHNGRIIQIHEDYKQVKHPIIHEITHYLQENTLNPEPYIEFDGTNFIEYYSQKVELEAHLIQIAYIIKHEKTVLNGLNSIQRKELETLFETAKISNPTSIVDLIRLTHHLKVL